MFPIGDTFVSPSSSLPSVGASGAIGAILGAYIVMFPRSQVRVLLLFGYFVVVRRVTAVLFLGIGFVPGCSSSVGSPAWVRRRRRPAGWRCGPTWEASSSGC